MEVECKTGYCVEFLEEFGNGGALLPNVFDDQGCIVRVGTEKGAWAVVFNVVGEDLCDDRIQEG